MFIEWGSPKFKKSRGYLATGLILANVGKQKLTVIVPKYPRFPIVPNQNVPREWVMFFQELEDFLKTHVQDTQAHNIT